MRRSGVAGAVAVVGLVLTGCSVDAGTDSEEGNVQESELEAELAEEYGGATWTVAPLDQIDGSEWYESDGVSFLLPADWVVDRTENEDFVHLRVYDPIDELNIVGITVASEGTSDGDVVLESDVTLTQLAARGAEGLERHLVEWETWPFAVGISGDVARDDADDSTFVSVGGNDEAESLRVGISATSDGPLEDSLQYEVLRTVRPAE